MKQKYTIIKDDAKHVLLIREYAELDKEILSLLCEETYPADTVKAHIAKGPEALIAALRTHNMYPPNLYAVKIAEAVAMAYASDGAGETELFFDDRELFAKAAEKEVETIADEEIDSDEDVLDELLDDELDEDLEDDFEDEKMVKNIKSPIQIAEDEPTDTLNEG